MPSRLGREVGIALLYVALAAGYSGLTSDLDTRIFSGPDPVIDAWTLNWVATHLFTSQVFEGNNFFPSHDAILFSDPLLGPAVLAAPMRLVGLGPVFAYNLTVILVLALASYGFHRLAYRLSGDWAASILAGVVIPYLPHQTYHLTHLNMVTIAGFPFLMLGLLRLLAAPSPGSAAWVGLWWAFQSGTSGYWAFAATVLALWVAAWHWRSFRSWRTWLYCGAAAAIGLALLYPYVAGFAALGSVDTPFVRGTDEQAIYAFDPVSNPLRSTSSLWAGVVKLPAGSPDPVFPGLTIVGLAAVGAIKGPRREARLLASVAALFVVLSLGPELRVLGQPVARTPMGLLAEHVPLLGAMRHPITLIVPALMCAGLLAVLGLRAMGVSRRPALLALVLGLATAEIVSPPPPRTEARAQVPRIYQVLLSLPRGAILELPLTAESERQWWSIHHGLPIVNGESAFRPEPHRVLARWVARDWNRTPAGSLEGTRALAYLKHHFPIRYVVVHPGASDALRRNVESTPSFVFVCERDGARLYHLANGGAGPELRRKFRDDQLGSGRLVARVRGRDGSRLTVRLNDTVLAHDRLTPDPRELAWTVPAPLVRRGMNVFVLETSGDAWMEVLQMGPVAAKPLYMAAAPGVPGGPRARE